MQWLTYMNSTSNKNFYYRSLRIDLSNELYHRMENCKLQSVTIEFSLQENKEYKPKLNEVMIMEQIINSTCL